MYAVTSTPFDSRTRATLRSAEFGFLGVMIFTCRQTPFFCGHPCMAGCFGRLRCATRGLRTSWLIVGMDRCRSFPLSKVATPGRDVTGRCVTLGGAAGMVKTKEGRRGTTDYTDGTDEER